MKFASATSQLVTGLALCLLSSITTVNAAETLEKRLSISSSQTLSIDVPRGTLTLKGSESDQVWVKGTLDQQTKRFVFQSNGDEVELKVELPKNWRGDNEEGSVLTIHYPSNNPLELSTVSADVQAESLGEANIQSVSGDIDLQASSGKLRIATVSGDIKTADLNGDIELETVSGTIDDKQSAGKLFYESVSGDIVIASQAERVDLENVSGDIEAKLASPHTLKARNVSGDLELTLASLDANAEIALDSVSGDLYIKTPNSVDLEIESQTGPGGGIDNRLTDDNPKKQKYSGSQKLNLKLGSGAGRLSINTVSGEITLTK